MLKKLICAIALLPFLSNSVSAEPIPDWMLSECYQPEFVYSEEDGSSKVVNSPLIPFWCKNPEQYQLIEGVVLPAKLIFPERRSSIDPILIARACNLIATGQYTYSEIKEVITASYYLSSTISYQARENIAQIQAIATYDKAEEHFKKTGNCNF